MNEEEKKLISDFQTLQQQLQNVLVQKETLKLQLLDIEKALEELNKTKEKEGYKIVGNVMIKKSVEEIKKDLENKKDDLNVKIKSLEKIEQKLTEKLKDIQEKLKPLVGQ